MDFGKSKGAITGDYEMSTHLLEIDRLAPESKRVLLAALARDLMVGQGGQLTVRDADGEMLVVALPAHAKPAAEQARREADPEYVAELHRRAVGPRQTMTFEEVIALRANPEATSQSQ
jgi:hypothetical protein